MGDHVHVRNTKRGKRYRVWNTHTDSYETDPMTRKGVAAYLLRKAQRITHQEIDRRLSWSDDRGTSNMVGPLQPNLLDSPWKTERCETCNRFHHDFSPSYKPDWCVECGRAKEHGLHRLPCEGPTNTEDDE